MKLHRATDSALDSLHLYFEEDQLRAEEVVLAMYDTDGQKDWTLTRSRQRGWSEVPHGLQ